MKPYEYRDDGGRVLCKQHHMLRCGECEYVDDLEQQNKIYRKALVNVRLGSESEVFHCSRRLNTINKIVVKALEDSK